MSAINVRSSRNAAGSVEYILYGASKTQRQELIAAGQTRAAATAISIADGGGTPAEFIDCAQDLARRYGRKVQLYSYVLAFHPDEFDVTSQEDLENVRDVAVELVERMHSADYLIAVHADAAGGHAHAHILVVNHDNLTGKSLQRYTSWKHGLHQLNDELMRDLGLAVLPDPKEPKPSWELRREAFTSGGFEQVLGDKIYLALADPRSVDREAFTEVLAEHGVALAITKRDGFSYKMRRADNGKLGRKKASTLTPEFTAEGVQQIFDFHAQNARKDVNRNERYESTKHTPAEPRQAAATFGAVATVDFSPRRHRRAADQAHDSSERSRGLDAGEQQGNARTGAGRSEQPERVNLAAFRHHVRIREGLSPQAQRDRQDPREPRPRAPRRGIQQGYPAVGASDSAIEQSGDFLP
jgi:hypothetical protein